MTLRERIDEAVQEIAHTEGWTSAPVREEYYRAGVRRGVRLAIAMLRERAEDKPRHPDINPTAGHCHEAANYLSSLLDAPEGGK